MKNPTCFASIILTVLSACTTTPSTTAVPIKLDGIGIQGATSSKKAAQESCRDIEEVLDLPRTTPMEKWESIVREYDLPVVDPTAGGNNEIHDCQGLIVSQGGMEKYGTFATLWVSDVLRASTFPRPTVVAAVAVLGPPYDGEYLDLRPTRNCIMLRGTNATDNGEGWDAWIVPIRDDEKCPAGGTVPGGTPLNVFRDPATGKPVAGRWVDTGNAYYIGLQCGNYFCVIGVPRAGNPPAGYNRLWAADSDHQRLATKNADGLLVPSGLRGTLSVAKVADRDRTATYHDREVPVATVTITGDNANTAWLPYASKWQVAVGMFANDTMHVYLRHRGPDPYAGWQSRSGNGPFQDVRFDKADHSGLGTMRWRWDPRDETKWIQCPEGCCATN
jgi:hypothetical protein